MYQYTKKNEVQTPTSSLLPLWTPPPPPPHHPLVLIWQFTLLEVNCQVKLHANHAPHLLIGLQYWMPNELILSISNVVPQVSGCLSPHLSLPLIHTFTHSHSSTHTHLSTLVHTPTQTPSAPDLKACVHDHTHMHISVVHISIPVRCRPDPMSERKTPSRSGICSTGGECSPSHRNFPLHPLVAHCSAAPCGVPALGSRHHGP